MNKNYVENYVNGLKNMPFAEVKKALKKIGFEWAANDDAYEDEGMKVRQTEFWYGNREYSVILIFKVGGSREMVDMFEFIDWAEWIATMETLIEKAKA